MERRFVRRADRSRKIVAHRVSTEKLAELDRWRRKVPADPAYGADFWRRQLLQLPGRRPGRKQTA
jgi:hypothetical protein